MAKHAAKLERFKRMATGGGGVAVLPARRAVDARQRQQQSIAISGGSGGGNAGGNGGGDAGSDGGGGDDGDDEDCNDDGAHTIFSDERDDKAYMLAEMQKLKMDIAVRDKIIEQLKPDVDQDDEGARTKRGLAPSVVALEGLARFWLTTRPSPPSTTRSQPPRMRRSRS